jgi:hypothetical protein
MPQTGSAAYWIGLSNWAGSGALERLLAIDSALGASVDIGATVVQAYARENYFSAQSGSTSLVVELAGATVTSVSNALVAAGLQVRARDGSGVPDDFAPPAGSGYTSVQLQKYDIAGTATGVSILVDDDRDVTDVPALRWAAPRHDPDDTGRFGKIEAKPGAGGVVHVVVTLELDLPDNCSNVAAATYAAQVWLPI